MAEIINGPVDLGEISEAGRKRVARAQKHGAATLCVPVAVEIRGGTFIPVIDNTHPWDTMGEFRFSIFIDKGRGRLEEDVIRYSVTGDGRMRRLVPSVIGYLNQGEENDMEPRRIHPIEDSEETLIRPRISWRKEVTVRGVDARINHVANPQTGQEEAILSFIAVPEPGQWGGVKELEDKFPRADRPRTLINTIDNPIPFLQRVGVIF